MEFSSFETFRGYAIDRGSRALEPVKSGTSTRVAGKAFDAMYPIIKEEVASEYEAAIADLEFQLYEAEAAAKPKTRRKPADAEPLDE